MSLDKKEIVAKFSGFLNDEIFKCINQDIAFDELQNYKKILIFQSASYKRFEETIREICQVNKTVELVIVGQSKCFALPPAYPDRKIRIIVHDKRFDADDAEIIDNIKKNHGSFEAVLYYSNFVNSLDYMNVEQLLLSIDSDIPIYNYSYAQQELNKISDIANHYHAVTLFKDLLEWFETWR